MTNRNRSPFTVDTGVAPSTLDGMGDQGSRLRDKLESMLAEYYPRDEDGNLYLPAPRPLPNLANLKLSQREPYRIKLHDRVPLCGMQDHDPGDEDRS